jgi:dolichyl-phosphate beta-glucosyltransferase
MTDSPLFDLSLVLPAYHEARRLPSTLQELGEFVRGREFSIEVLIVVEQGTDGTFDIARKFAAQHPHFRAIDNGEQRGKGHAVRAGMLQARGDCVLYMDSDLSVPLREVVPFLHHFDKNPETAVIIGDRQHARSRITRRQSHVRELMGRTFNAVLQRLMLSPWRDTQCGFKAFRRAACQEIFRRQKIDGFAFDVEVLLLAARLGYRVDALPVEWINSEESKVRIVRDSARMLLDALRVRRVVEATLREPR